MALKPCGTEAAYRRHLRAGEDPCDECREAHRSVNAIGRKAAAEADALERRSRLMVVGADLPEVRDAKTTALAAELPDMDTELAWMYDVLKQSLADAPPQNRPGIVREMRDVLRERRESVPESDGQSLDEQLAVALQAIGDQE